MSVWTERRGEIGAGIGRAAGGEGGERERACARAQEEKRVPICRLIHGLKRLTETWSTARTSSRGVEPADHTA